MASHSAVPYEHGEGDDDYFLQVKWVSDFVEEHIKLNYFLILIVLRNLGSEIINILKN